MDNPIGYSIGVYRIAVFVRSSGGCPFEDFRQPMPDHGDGVAIDVAVRKLSEEGFRLAGSQRAKKMNGVWELRPRNHRVFFFWDDIEGHFVLLHGHRKQKARAPKKELERAEAMRHEYADLVRSGRRPWRPWRG